MTGLDSPAATRALAQALHADRQIWTAQHDSARHRRTRNHAIALALAAGMSKEQLADELGVLISDIEQMAAAAQHAPETHAHT